MAAVTASKPAGRIGVEIVGPNHEKFVLDEYLGGGSFGEVYKATGLTSGLIVAVKLVPQQKLSDPTTLALRTVINETRAEMLKVSHPNVVRVLHADSGTNPDIGPYVIMEYVEGGNLQQLLDERRANSRPFELDQALSLMRGIALGAQAINEHLIHRDIKPDNILLDGPSDDPRPRIADFGLAKVATEITRPETFKGIQAVWYMAPEVWRDEKHTTKIDIYSTGLVFYQILTLEHPLCSHIHDLSDVVKWRAAHLTTLCPDMRSARSDVPISLAKLLLRMTDKSPGNRPNWDEVLGELNPRNSSPRMRPSLDPKLLAAFRSQADERLRDERAKAAADLERKQKAEIEDGRREEYRESCKRLLGQFDDVVEALNEEERSYQVQFETEPLTRNYVLPNGRRLHCGFSEYAGAVKSPRGLILGGGYIGVVGALSANLILFGQPDDVASASWCVVEASVMALIYGSKRESLYRAAGMLDADMLFLEHLDRATWSQNAQRYFGFRDLRLFLDEFIRGISAMHVYSFNMQSEVMKSFTEILMLGLRMPSIA